MKNRNANRTNENEFDTKKEHKQQQFSEQADIVYFT